MKVILDFRRHNCIIERQGGPKIYSESLLLHKIKVELRNQGHDVIKKRMWKDGHMVADTCQYIRLRNDDWCVWDDQYCVRNMCTDYNKEAAITLRLEHDHDTQRKAA